MSAPKKSRMEHSPEVQKFVEFLKIRTVHPDPAYKESRLWLLDYVADIGLEVVVDKEYHPGKPVIVVKLPGTNPELPSVLLNSHVDVVPVEQDKWIVDAFSGHITDDGKIYGRGTQDMKCVCIQHLEAVRRIKDSGTKLRRDLYLSLVPDEEIGGMTGMQLFALSGEFKELNVGLALDEGLAREDDAVTVFYGERHKQWTNVTFSGNPGHGSRFIENTAVEKMRKLVNKALDYRENQRKRLLADACMTLGEVTTVNVTMIHGGTTPNVVPSEFTVTLDCRVSHEYAFEEFKNLLKSWIDEAGGGEMSFIASSNNDALSSIDPKDKWWNAITGACKKHSVKLVPEIFPAGTDSRYLRAQGIPAYGFSPINNTPILLHDHNEWLGVDTFMRGIDILGTVIRDLANVSG
ncbi:aminoacylase-1-like isoform X1 [Bolinopsis microptera]|uniref:aminoacylase-1-like isoform X1 n=1 Tax=Bolinopsis microptera TaxID=2820187 RepID=UPI00307A08BE